jgi:hypothetical protein
MILKLLFGLLTLPLFSLFIAFLGILLVQKRKIIFSIMAFLFISGSGVLISSQSRSLLEIIVNLILYYGLAMILLNPIRNSTSINRLIRGIIDLIQSIKNSKKNNSDRRLSLPIVEEFIE